MNIQCFFLEPLPWAEESFRRFAWSEDGKCPGRYGSHDASFLIGAKAPWDVVANGIGEVPSDELKKDPRWPKKCASCDYVFAEKNPWQHNFNRLYKRSDDGSLVTLGAAPAGAMWHADWMGDRYRGPDGRCLVVRTPGGDWTVDGPSSGGGGWKRTGTIPNITATPSILFPETKTTDGRVIEAGYHGWLRNGVLVAC